MGKNFRGAPREERALSAYVKLARAANSAMAFARASYDHSGLTPSQFAVLEALHHVGPLNLGDLARRILTSSGNLTLVVDNLESAAWPSASKKARTNDLSWLPLRLPGAS